MVWMALVVCTLAVYVASLPLAFAQLQTPCTANTPYVLAGF
jgi:hypothetical protein